MRILRRFLARVKNFAMGQRSREFGIRIAVGAIRGNVMAVVFHQGLVLTLIAISV
jgi:ABC-type antimicrobial peptide transport system permease subunit